MGQLPDDRFRIFVSHKHEDHSVAVAFQDAVEALCPKIECFVSGVSIAAGADWSREIRTHIVQSHMFVLLFTRPAAAWDWCLFETGLFTRADIEEISAVVCLFDADETTPSPLANLQGVPVHLEAVERFLADLCKQTWCVSDDWRRGAINPRVRQEQLVDAAAAIVAAFQTGARAEAPYYPCHRLVLDMHGVEVDGVIPDEAKVVIGPRATTEYTLSLFNLAGGCGDLKWGELLDAVDGRRAAWRTQLDRRFAAALNEELFTPITATFRAWNQGRRRQRILKPVLYRIVRQPDSAARGGDGGRGEPVELTLLFDSHPIPPRSDGSELNLIRINARFQVEVIDEFLGTVHAREREGLPVLDDIGEAIDLVYDEANTYGVFDVAELHRIYGDDYTERGIDAMGRRWESALDDLRAAMTRHDLDAVETHLSHLRELNRKFSTLSAERYLRSLESESLT